MPIVQNPQIIRGFEPDPEDSEKAKENRATTSHYTLVIPRIDISKTGHLIFYNLDLGKVVKKISDGKALVSYRKAAEP